MKVSHEWKWRVVVSKHEITQGHVVMRNDPKDCVTFFSKANWVWLVDDSKQTSITLANRHLTPTPWCLVKKVMRPQLTYFVCTCHIWSINSKALCEKLQKILAPHAVSMSQIVNSSKKDAKIWQDLIKSGVIFFQSLVPKNILKKVSIFYAVRRFILMSIVCFKA